ncbi:MAG TPA: EAL domain-containing protein [Paracoccaceae bacterium]|nr:EAL domain-containing protein [Paracoccaceae bacterium]
MIKTSRDLSSQIHVALAVLATLASVAAVAVAVFAASRADEESISKQQQLVEHAFNEQIEALETEQVTVTVWDDAVIYARSADQQWLADNMGDWMYDFYGHDRAYVFDDRNRLIYVMRGGETAATPSLREDESVLAEAASDLRERLVGRSAQGDAAEALEEIAETRFVMLGEMPALLGVRPILPYEGRVTIPEGEEYLYASLQFLDDVLAQEIGANMLVADAHFTTEPPTDFGSTSFAIETADGQPFLYLGWDADRPGFQILKQVLPVLLLALLVLGGIAIRYNRKLRKTSCDLHDSERQTRHLATHDILTRLPNRGLFEDRLNETLAKVRAGKGEAAVLFLDLDRFKTVNDTLGHRAGDELVREAAARLNSIVGTAGTIARVGGDEFGLVLWTKKNAEKAAIAIAEKIIPALSAPFNIDDEVVHIGVSIGIAVAPDAGLDREELLRKADIALYDAKSKGRARYQVFSENMGDVLKRRRRVEADLRTAIAEGDQLQLHYQPLHSSDGAMIGAEALLRWNHPVHRSLSPMVVISVAEESGLIMRLGDWILSEACRMAISADLPLMSVNVSAVQLRDEHFAERCLAILRKERVEPSRIQIEVTETVLIENPDLAIRTFTRLRAAGVRVAIDDFGTGYSSMSYLQNYPVDRVKIDRSFVQAMSAGDQGHAIVAAMLEMARALDLFVIAEGVETAEQSDLLRSLGCHEMQGYHYSKPLEASVFLDRVAGRENMTA